MLKKRLIPKLLITKDEQNNPIVVTTVGFSKRLIVGDPVSQAKIYQHQMVDELVFLNIDDDNKLSIAELAELANEVSEEIFMPVTFGGGIKSKNDVQLLLKNGADKISINSNAILNPEFITELSTIYGSQCVVVSIDYVQDETGMNYVHCKAQNYLKKIPLLEWVVEVQRLGAGEIILTSVENDGAKCGIDIKTLQEVTSAVNIPVIVSGGCGLAKHFIEALREGNADAVSAGTYFAFKDENPMQCRSQIFNSGLHIRRLT